MKTAVTMHLLSHCNITSMQSLLDKGPASSGKLASSFEGSPDADDCQKHAAQCRTGFGAQLLNFSPSTVISFVTGLKARQ